MQISRELSVQSEIPPDVSTEDLVQRLHNPEFVLKLSKDVESVKQTSHKSHLVCKDDPDYDWFEVSEKVPIVGHISFLAGFFNQTDGYDSKFYAQAGLVMQISARVTNSTFTERCTLRGSLILMPYVTWQFNRAHRRIHSILYQRVRESKGQGQNER